MGKKVEKCSKKDKTSKKKEKTTRKKKKETKNSEIRDGTYIIILIFKYFQQKVVCSYFLNLQKIL